jgi:hypothetical protein
MKNILILLLTLITTSIHAQNHLIGVKGGVNRTDVSATSFFNDRDVRLGLEFGLTYDYFFKNNFTMGADLIYNQRGFTFDIIFTDDYGIPTGEKSTTKFNYDYISLPLKVGFMHGKTFSIFANIGLTPSILVDAKYITPTFEFNELIIHGETIDITKNVKMFDLGGIVEIGVGYRFKERYWLYSSFSYQHSLTSISTSEHFATSAIRHYGMTLSLGLKYALTKE